MRTLSPAGSRRHHHVRAVKGVNEIWREGAALALLLDGEVVRIRNLKFGGKHEKRD